jgi:hypothetical protein
VGWAWNPNWPNDPIRVDVYDGTTLLGSTLANAFRQDLLNAGKGNGYHGFNFSLPNSVRNGSAHSISVKFRGTATNLTWSPRSVTCHPPKGYMDGITATGYASGWVCDPDAPQVSSQVRLASSAGYIGLYTTNLSNEQAVSTACGGGTLHRFGVQLPAWTKGLPIYAYAEDLGAPYATGEVQIPWICPAGWSCTW